MIMQRVRLNFLSWNWEFSCLIINVLLFSEWCKCFRGKNAMKVLFSLPLCFFRVFRMMTMYFGMRPKC